MPEQIYFSQDKDALLRSKGFDPAMVYGKVQELDKFRNPSFSTSPLIETPIQIGSGYEYQDVNSFGEQLLNSYINQVYLTTPKGIANFIPTVGLAVAKDNSNAAKFFDNWIKGATNFFDKGKQDVTPTESYLKSGSPLAFASSLGQGLGFVASMFAGSAIKAPAALGAFGKYAVGAGVSTPVLQSMYYEEAVNSGIDKKDAAIFSSVLAPISALSEYVGFEMMGNAITKPIIGQVRKKALLEGVKEFAAKGATKAAFYDAASMSSKVYAQSMKELFSNLAVRGTRGAFAEGSQEFAQSYLEEGAKQVYDTYFAKGAEKKFGANVATNFKGAIEEAFFGGVIGAVLGGGGGAVYNPVFEESLFNVLDKARNKEYAADKLKKDIVKYAKAGKLSEQEAAYGNQLVDGIANFVKTELPKTITDPIARFQALRLTDVKNDLTASLSGNPSLLPDYVPMQIERVESALKQIGNSNTPIADFNGLLMELVQIENEVKQKNGWNEIGQQGTEDTAVETEEAGIGEGVAADNQGIEGIGAAELEPIEGVNEGVIDGVNEGVNQQATLETNQAATQAEEKPIAEQVAEYEGILTRNQDKLTKLRSSKLRKGETQEKRDAAIANLEQQESMVREKLDALKQQMPQVEPTKKEEVAEAQEEKEVKEKTTKELRKEALSIDGFDAQDFVLQYFAGGGKIHPDVLRAIYGVKNNEEATKIKVRGEQKARIGLLSSKAKAKTPDAIAEQVYNEVPEYLRDTISLSEVHDAVIDAINSYVSVKQMSKALISKYADKEAMIQKASESRQSAAFYEDLTDEEVDAAMETPEIIEAAELTYDTLSDEQKAAFDGLIERFTVDGVTDYDAINKAMEDFNFEADEIFVFNVNQLLDNNLKSVLDDYQKRSQNQDIIGEDANKEGVAQKELAEQTRAAEEALISARNAYENKKRQLGKDLLEEQPALFEEKREDILFETQANVGRGNINAILKPYQEAVKSAEMRVAELKSPEMIEKAKAADALQARLSLDQEVINNAMDAAEDGIQDMTLDDMEDKGIIKRDCE